MIMYMFFSFHSHINPDQKLLEKNGKIQIMDRPLVLLGPLPNLPGTSVGWSEKYQTIQIQSRVVESGAIQRSDL